MNKPPFTITPAILSLSMRITHVLGTLDGLKLDKPKVELRKNNQIKTIQASLAIEGNTLSLEQVSDILDGNAVLGSQKEIVEVKNAIAAYNNFSQLNYRSIAALNKTHKLMMHDLLKDAGRFREKNVGVFAGAKVAHVAPSHKRVSQLMTNLFAFIKNQDDISLLIKSCIFHYELEFIHPYSDGNGRMGRFWQHLMLTAFHPIFKFVPVESLIKDQQKAYYSVLAKCDNDATSTAFIEFMLHIILASLQTYTDTARYAPKTARDRLSYAKQLFSNEPFTRKKYNAIFKNISTATASRDLKLGVDEKILIRAGKQRLSTYYFNN